MANLKEGAKGGDVKKLQTLLNKMLKSGKKLVVDEVFGPKTLEAVKRFQKQAEIKPTGVVDQATWDALEGKKPPAPDKETLKQIDALKKRITKLIDGGLDAHSEFDSTTKALMLKMETWRNALKTLDDLRSKIDDAVDDIDNIAGKSGSLKGDHLKLLNEGIAIQTQLKRATDVKINDMTAACDRIQQGMNKILANNKVLPSKQKAAEAKLAKTFNAAMAKAKGEIGAS